MKMPSKHVLLLFLSFFFYTRCLYLVDHRLPKLRTYLGRKTVNLSDLRSKIQKFDVSRRIQGTGRRENVKDNQEQSETTGTFVNCVFKVDNENQPVYDCKHSQDVKINWTREDGRLIGTFSKEFHCSNRRDVRNKMESERNKVSRKWKQLIRDKRRTVYRDDDEAEEVRDEEVQQTEEDEDDVPEVNQDVPEEEAEIEDSEVPGTTNGEQEISDEEDKERPIDAIEDDENEDKGQSEFKVSLKNSEGSVEDTEDPGEETVVEEKMEVNETEKEEDNEVDIVAEDSVDKEESIEETSTNDENDDNTNDEGKSDEADEEKSDEAETVEEKSDETETVEEKSDETETVEEKSDETETVEEKIEETETVEESDDKSNATIENVNEEDHTVNHNELILVPIQVEIELIVTQPELPLLTQLVQEILYEIGDYLLSIISRNLKHRLRHARIEERFDHKVEKLAKSHGNDTIKALLLMKNKIHEQLGKSYQLEIVRFLKQLHEDLKQ